MMEAFFLCLLTAGVSYVLLSHDRSLVNVLSIGAVYGFIGFIVCLLLSSKGEFCLGEVFATGAVMVALYRSRLTSSLLQKRR